jgi:hypothetical protein
MAMKVSPFAGKPAELSMLVDVPKLITAYYTEVPDPSVPAQRVYREWPAGCEEDSFREGASRLHDAPA